MFPLLIFYFTYWNLIFINSVLHFMQLCSVVHNVLTFTDMAAFSTALWMHDKNNAYTAVNVCLSWCARGQNDAASKFSRNVEVAAGSFVHTQCLQQISLYSTPLVFMQQNHLRTATDTSSHGNAPTTFTQQHTHLHNDNTTNLSSHSNTPIFTLTCLYTATMSDRTQKCIKMIYSK